MSLKHTYLGVLSQIYTLIVDHRYIQFSDDGKNLGRAQPQHQTSSNMFVLGWRLLHEHTAIDCYYLIGHIAGFYHPHDRFSDLLRLAQSTDRDFCHDVSKVPGSTLEEQDHTIRETLASSWQHCGVGDQRWSDTIDSDTLFGISVRKPMDQAVEG